MTPKKKEKKTDETRKKTPGEKAAMEEFKKIEAEEEGYKRFESLTFPDYRSLVGWLNKSDIKRVLHIQQLAFDIILIVEHGEEKTTE